MSHNNHEFGKQPFPQTWRKIGRHRVGGWGLTDLVSPDRLEKVAKEVRRFMAICRIMTTLDDVLYRIDNQFRGAFFAKRFGELDMSTAAEIYVDYLEQHAMSFTGDKEEYAERFRRHTKDVLLSLDPKKFYVHCFHYQWEIPSSLNAAVQIMHHLRLTQDYVPESEKQLSRDWLATHLYRPDDERRI